MLGPEFLFTRSKGAVDAFLLIFARFGVCHKGHMTQVGYGCPLPYKIAVLVTNHVKHYQINHKRKGLKSETKNEEIRQGTSNK